MTLSRESFSLYHTSRNCFALNCTPAHVSAGGEKTSKGSSLNISTGFVWKPVLVLCFLFMNLVDLEAQTTISAETGINPVKQDSTYFLDEWVLEGSIEIFYGAEIISPDWWSFDVVSGRISFSIPDSLQQEIQSLVVRYQVLPLNISRTLQPRQPVELDTAIFADDDSLSGVLAERNASSAFQDSELQQSGSLSRGIIVGTNQDFALESGLNFELSGKLTENIDLNASLTDQSIPIQPDGTTQNLREFDRVFIQLQAPNASVAMGDVDVSLEQSTFARLNRRLQGATGSLNSSAGDYTGALSVVRGTYKSVSFSGQDGVQGPYRLTGRNDEEFVIILAGTERVYINGQRVQRGAENDYIIDYGLGELTFTSNLLIKDETRIVVEYEYVDQNFNRTLVAAEGGEEFMDGRFKIGATVIRQADGNDLLSQQTLTQDDIDLLEMVGDDLDQARVNGAVIADEDEREDFVLYAQVDTTLNGESYSIYKHLPGSPDAIYRVSFTNVGEGEGSYLRTGGEVNGLLYEWVGPGNGSYEPFRNLPAPEKQQMVALNGSYRLSENVELFGEWAASDYDQNRFSSLDDDDNTDMAYDSGIRISQAESGIGEINGLFRRRYSGERFQFFERTREVEFDRKWNITRNTPSSESINEAVLNVSPTNETTVGGEFGFVQRDRFTGYRQASSVNSNEEGIFNLRYDQDWVRSEDEVLSLNGNWFRQQGELAKDFGNETLTLTPFVYFEQERRIQRDADDDSLSQLSFSFYDVGPGARLAVSDWVFEAGIGYRAEDRVLDNELRDESTALEQRYRVNYLPGDYFHARNEVKIRNKEFTDDFINQGSSNRKGLLIKSLSDYRSANEEIEGELLYQANTQRRALLQESYVEVGPEVGQYVWDDINGDGVQQVDEFFPEVSINEGTFIRQFLPSDELFPVIDLNVRWINSIRPLKIIGLGEEKETPLSDMLLRSRIDITENSTTNDLQDVYLLRLNTFRNDSATIDGRLFWEQELDLFPSFRKADLRLGYNQNKSLTQRSSESIRSYTDLWYLNGAYNITERVRLNLEAISGTNRSLSSRLQSRNYNIESIRITPGAEATISRSWSTGLDISYTRKTDRYPSEDVEATLVKISTTQRAYLWRKMQANLRLELRNTTVNGNSSTYGTYELTEGTGEGTNVIWSLNSSYRLSNLIRINLNYDGRTVKNRPAIHTIKLVMSAVF